MPRMLTTLLVLTLLAGPVAAIVPRAAARILAGAAAASLVLAAAALAGHPAAALTFSVEGIGSLVLVLTTGMGATVLAFAQRNLRDEPYQRRFTVLGALVVTAATAVALTDDLVVLAGAWVATSLLTVALLRTGPEAGRDARSLRARRAFVAGDLALVAAVVILLAGGPAVAAGLLALVAAASRSASGPFHRWLPDSLGAPTPASALLHAGVVNGGPILLIKLAPELGDRLPLAVAVATVLVGAITCVLAEAVMLTRPDVKGRLAWSTIAQMSFTLLLCGLGLPLAAGLHLVAHGWYKGALFLGSGSGVRTLVRDRQAPLPVARSPWRHRAASGAAGVAPVLALVAVAAVAGAHRSPELVVPLGLAAVASFEAGRAALARTRGWLGAVAVLGAVAALAAAYAATTSAIDRAVTPQLDAPAPAIAAWWLIPVLGALAAVAASWHRRRPQARAGLWRLVEAAGRPDPTFRIDRPRTPVHRPAVVHLPAPGPHPSLDPIPVRSPAVLGRADLAGASA